jgi:hypothetical protein
MLAYPIVKFKCVTPNVKVVNKGLFLKMVSTTEHNTSTLTAYFLSGLLIHASKIWFPPFSFATSTVYIMTTR